jgi:hypothetical protein
MKQIWFIILIFCCLFTVAKAQLRFPNKLRPVDNASAKAPQSGETLTLISPNGGEIVTANGFYTIIWEAENLDKINIDFSTDNGQNWNSIIKNLAANPQQYNWSVPNVTSYSCKVRISAASNPGLHAESSADFTITKMKALYLLSPDGGEKLQADSDYLIQWKAANLPDVDISYSLNGGLDWKYIAQYVDAATWSYAWIVPDTPASLCKVRITDASDTNIYSESRTYFSIVRVKVRSLALGSPQNSEILKAGQLYSITWTEGGIEKVNLSFSADGGRSWTNFAMNRTASLQNYAWTVPDTSSDSCRLRISDASDTGFYRETAGFFRIEKTAGIRPEGKFAENLLIIYPNPVTDRLNIMRQGYSFNCSQVAIFSPDGRLVYSAASGSTAGEINLYLENRLKAGVYFLRITEDQKTTMTRFVVSP